MSSLLLRGNCWGVITDRAGAGLLPSQVDLVHPDRVAVTVEDGRNVYRVNGEEISRTNLFHVKAYTFPGSVLGLSPIAYAREAMGLGIAAERYGAKFFGDAAIPSGVLTSDQRIAQGEADNLKARWKQAHQGRKDIAVLGGGARFMPVSIAPNEAQFVEAQKFNVSAICRFYGIDPRMMGGESAGHMDYSSPEQRGMDFLTFTLRPWLVRVERAVSGLLPSTQRAKFNAGGFLRATQREQYEALSVGVAGGFVTPNEARDKLDLPPLAGLDRPPPQEGIA